MKHIEEYINRSLKERQAHLKLDEQCLNRGGRGSADCRGLLADKLNTTIPNRGIKPPIFVCHACNTDWCTNPNHLYWGTPKDNQIDRLNNGAPSAYHCLVNKYGEERAKEMMRERGRKGGKANKRGDSLVV